MPNACPETQPSSNNYEIKVQLAPVVGGCDEPTWVDCDNPGETKCKRGDDTMTWKIGDTGSGICAVPPPGFT